MLFDDLKKEKILALKNKDKETQNILGIVINKAMLLGIEKKTKNEELTDGDVINIINKTAKELDDEISSFKKLNRTDDVLRLEAQKNAILKYVPSQLTDDEIRNEISKLDDKSIQSIMKHFKSNFNGLCDMKKVSQIAKDLE